MNWLGDARQQIMLSSAVNLGCLLTDVNRIKSVVGSDEGASHISYLRQRRPWKYNSYMTFLECLGSHLLATKRISRNVDR